MAAEFPVVFALYPRVTQLDFTGPYEVFARLPGAECVLASTSGGARSPDASTTTGTAAPRARSVSAAASPSSIRGGRTPAAIVRRSAIVAATSSTAEAGGG